MCAAERWLRDLVPGAPTALMDAMVGALATDAGEAVPEALERVPEIVRPMLAGA